jgi:predicted ATPase
MLHGRDAVISMVRRWLDGVGKGAGGAIHLVGVAGVGKSATLTWAAEQAESRRMRVLRVSGHPEESNVAWSGLSQIVTPFLATLDQFDERPRQVLLRTLRLGDDGEVDDVSIGMAVLLMLTRSDESVTVVIDDVQWLDPESLRVLSFVARRLNATGVGFLSAGHPGTAIIGQRVDLDALDQAALRAIARDRGVAAAVAEVLAEQAEGLPLVLDQIIAGLDADQRSGRRPLPEPIAEIARVDLALAGRISSLPTDARAVLAAAALAPWADVETIAELLGIDGSDAAIAPPVDRGLVTLTDGRLVFAHPTVRTAAAQVSLEERPPGVARRR